MLAELDEVSEDVLLSLRQDFHTLCEPHEGIADVLKIADLPKWFTDADKFNEMFPVIHAQDFNTGGSLSIGGKSRWRWPLTATSLPKITRSPSWMVAVCTLIANATNRKAASPPP